MTDKAVESWRVQDTIQGLDGNGLTHMLNVRADTTGELLEMLKALAPHIKGWKPLPVRQFGGGGGGGGKPPPKEIKSWADVPCCKTHTDTKLVPNPWKDHPGVFFWNCPKSRDCKNGTATQAEYDAYGKLDPEGKTAVPVTGKISHWLARGTVIAAVKKTNATLTMKEVCEHLDLLVSQGKFTWESTDAEIVKAINTSA